MEKKPYHEIDDLFKKAFEKGGIPEAEGWNVPSDEVWEKLSQKERKRRPIIYWKWAAVAASFALLFLVAQSIYYTNQLKQQAEKIKHIEKQLQDQSNDYRTTINARNNKPVELIDLNDNEGEALQKEDIKITEKQANLPFDFKDKDYIISNSSRGVITRASVLSPLSKDTIIKQLPNVQKIVLPYIALKNNNQLEALVSSIPLLSIDFPELEIPKINSPSNTPKSSLTVSYALLESAQTFDHKRHPIFSSNVVQEKNLNLGLRYTYRLGEKWFLESGLHYTKSTAQREHRLRTRFQRNNERPSGNGNWESTHSLSLLSSAYGLETDIILSRSNTSTTIADGSNLVLSAQATNYIEQLSIPILLGHRFQYNRWNIAIKAGLTANIQLDNRIEINQIRSQEGGFMVKEFSRTRRLPNLQRKTVETHFYLSSAVSYQLDEKWALQLEPYFSRSIASKLTALRQPVYAHSTGVHLGLKYAL